MIPGEMEAAKGDLEQMIDVRLGGHALAPLAGVAARGKIRRLHDQGYAAHRIGSCTVTSLVPSGKVASTWISWIISAMPSIT